MAGPWDKYAANEAPPQTTSRGPWEKYTNNAPPADPQPRTAEAAIEGFGQAATAGYLPQLQALAGGLIGRDDSVNRMLEKEGFTIKEPEDTYVSRRDSFARRGGKLAEENTAAYAGGLLGGAITTAPLAGSALKAFSPVGGAATTIGNAIKGGAVMGALQNPGETEGEISPVQPVERLKGAAIGGALGGAGQLVTKGIAKSADFISKLPKTLENYAELKAFKSAGPYKKHISKAMTQNRVNEIGREMLDKGVVKAGATFEDVADKSGELREKAGQVIHDVYDMAQSEINASPELRSALRPTQFDTSAMADDLLVSYRKELKGKAGGTKALGTLEQVLEELKQNGPDANLADIQQFRRSVDAMINYNKDISDQPLAKQGLYNLRTKLNQAISNRLGAMDKALGGGRLGALKEANRQYSIWSDVEDMARNRVGAENVNRMISLTDTIAGAGGGVAGAVAGGLSSGDLKGAVKGAAIGASAGLLNKAGRLYGNPLIAKGAQSVGRAAGKVPGLGALSKAGGMIGSVNAGLIAPRLKMPERKDAK